MDTEPGALDQTLRLREDAVTWRLVGEEVVALDVDRSIYLGVNSSGAVVWTALAKGATRQELVALLLQEFEVGSEEATRDVDALLAEIAERGLLEETRET